MREKEQAASDYLNTVQLERRTGGALRTSFLIQARSTGRNSPPFLKIGHKVVYYWPDVQEWLAAHRQTEVVRTPRPRMPSGHAKQNGHAHHNGAKLKRVRLLEQETR
jgi:hypothetical protein